MDLIPFDRHTPRSFLPPSFLIPIGAMATGADPDFHLPGVPTMITSGAFELLYYLDFHVINNNIVQNNYQ